MLKPKFTGQFKRDYKLAIKRGCNPRKLEDVIIGYRADDSYFSFARSFVGGGCLSKSIDSRKI